MRTARHLLAAAFIFLPISACVGSDDGSEAGAGAEDTPVRGGSVTIVELADMSKPMPLISESSLDNEVNGVLYMTLLGPFWENGELRYRTSDEDATALAKSYEFFGPDSASIRYNMRTDVRWSDSRPVTAHDAAWTIQMRGDPRVASPRQGYNEQIREVVAENDSTLVIHFTKRYPEIFFHTAGAVAPRHLYEGTDPSQLRSHDALNNPAGGALVVSGPYMIQEWQRGSRVVLVPNPQFRPQPYIERVVFVILPEETTRVVELQTGNVDVMELPFDKLEMLRQTVPDLRFETRRRRFYDYIAYNPAAHPAFADPEIRRALGLAINRTQLIQALNLGEYAEPAGGPYAPIFRTLFDPTTQAPLPFDTLESKRILDAKGWTPGPDGVRVRNGQRLAFTLATNAGNQRRADVGQIVQQEWRRIGVEVRLSTVESNTFFDQLDDREYEAAIAGWGVGLSPDLSALWTGDGPFNFTNYNNADVNRLVGEALAQPTEASAAPIWREAAGHIVADQPYTWLFYLDAVVGVRNRVRNTRIDTLGMIQNLHEWWIAGAAEGAPGGS